MYAYWLGIMALGIAIALALWIILVLRADRKVPDRKQASSPLREIIGGQFEARRGGRQVMPDPTESITHGSAGSGPEQPSRERPIPEQRTALPEQHPAIPGRREAIPEQREETLSQHGSPGSGAGGHRT